MGANAVSNFTFTDKERAAQDRRLDSIIARVWDAGLITWLRNQPELQAVHQNWQAMTEAGDTRVIPDYLRKVLDLALTAAGPFVPIDVWPAIPAPIKLPPDQQGALQVIANKIREEAGIFTPGKLLLNKHYFLLVAHIFYCPDEIHKGSDIFAPCYPWPFLLQIDGEGTARLEIQEDIGDDQWPIVERMNRRLVRDMKQARAYGVGHGSVERQVKMKRLCQAVGRAITQAYDDLQASGRAQPDIITAVMEDPTVRDACKVPGAEIALTRRRVRQLHKEDRVARGLPLPQPGRPRKNKSTRATGSGRTTRMERRPPDG